MNFDYYFWFTQPSTFLNSADKMIFYILAGMLIATVVLFLGRFLVRHEVVRKIVNKFFNLAITTGLIGMIWYGFRYESVPIFGRRYWIGLLAVLFLIWFGYIIKYILTEFREEKAEYDKYLLNSKYLPASPKTASRGGPGSRR